MLWGGISRTIISTGVYNEMISKCINMHRVLYSFANAFSYQCKVSHFCIMKDVTRNMK